MSQQKSPKKEKDLNNLIKFSGVAFEMAATIALCVFLGKFLDGHFEIQRPILTAIFSIFGVVGAIYNLIRKVTKN